jgi:Uma2 family endonuclease
MSAQPLPRMSVEEYLEFDRNSEFRYEYFDGFVYAMSGGTLPHNLIAANLIRRLGNALEGKGCAVVGGSLRVQVSPRRDYFYPDVVVVCGEMRIADDRQDTLLNPTLVIEVLSKSTESLDRGLKATRYRALASVREYVLVSQTEPRVEVFERLAEGKWDFREVAGSDAVCEFHRVGCEIPLSRIYELVTFSVTDN